MNKKIIVFFVLLVMLLPVFFSCNQSMQPMQQNNEKKLSTASPELLELLAVSDEIAYRFVKKDISFADFEKAYKTNDITFLKTALDMTDKEYDEYTRTINKISTDILEKYSDIRAEYERMRKEGRSCSEKLNLEEIYTKIHSANFFTVVDGKVMSKTRAVSMTREDTDCKWIAYTACLAACTASGPVIYWPCAYVCLCSFCTNHPLCE